MIFKISIALLEVQFLLTEHLKVQFLGTKAAQSGTWIMI